MTLGRGLHKKILLFICFNGFVCFISCDGQNSIQFSTRYMINKDECIAKGDTVAELGNNLMHILQDKNNHYWFGGHEDGVYRYDGKNIIHFTTKDGLCNNKIEKIQEDKWGHIYFTTGGGICKYDGKSFSLLNVTDYSNKWKLEPDDLWFKGAQDSGVVYRYDGKVLYRLTFPKTKMGEEFISNFPYDQYPNMNYNPYDIYCTYKDSKGYVWFGSGTLGACRYDGKTITWISDADVVELGDDTNNGVRSIIEDKQGKFWLSNTLYRYTVEDKNGMTYMRERSIGSLDDKNGGLQDFYMSAVKDDRDDLWIATYGLGVWKYDEKNLTHYPLIEGNNVATLYSIYKDNKGALWVGTHEYGVYKFNGERFERFKP